MAMAPAATPYAPPAPSRKAYAGHGVHQGTSIDTLTQHIIALEQANQAKGGQPGEVVQKYLRNPPSGVPQAKMAAMLAGQYMESEEIAKHNQQALEGYNPDQPTVLAQMATGVGGLPVPENMYSADMHQQGGMGNMEEEQPTMAAAGGGLIAFAAGDPVPKPDGGIAGEAVVDEAALAREKVLADAKAVVKADNAAKAADRAAAKAAAAAAQTAPAAAAAPAVEAAGIPAAAAIDPKDVALKAKYDEEVAKRGRTYSAKTGEKVAPKLAPAEEMLKKAMINRTAKNAARTAAGTVGVDALGRAAGFVAKRALAPIGTFFTAKELADVALDNTETGQQIREGASELPLFQSTEAENIARDAVAPVPQAAILKARVDRQAIEAGNYPPSRLSGTEVAESSGVEGSKHLDKNGRLTRPLNKEGVPISSARGAFQLLEGLYPTGGKPVSVIGEYKVLPPQNDSYAEHARTAYDIKNAYFKHYKGDAAKADIAYYQGPSAVDAAVKKDPANWLSNVKIKGETNIPAPNYLAKLEGRSTKSNFDIAKDFAIGAPGRVVKGLDPNSTFPTDSAGMGTYLQDRVLTMENARSLMGVPKAIGQSSIVADAIDYFTGQDKKGEAAVEGKGGKPATPAAPVVRSAQEEKQAQDALEDARKKAESANATAEDKKFYRDLGIGLMQAGFRMMSSKNPYFGGAVGEGGEAGLSGYIAARGREEERGTKRAAQQETARSHLATEANNRLKLATARITEARKRALPAGYTPEQERAAEASASVEAYQALSPADLKVLGVTPEFLAQLEARAGGTKDNTIKFDINGNQIKPKA